MKILVFATQHMETGGIESHLQQFCEQMAQADVRIDLVILNSGMSAQTEIFYKSVCNNVYLGHHGRSYKRLSWLTLTALKLLKNHYDALYTNGQGSSAGMFAKLVRFNNWVHHHHTAGDVADQSTWRPSYVRTLVAANHVIACAHRNANDMAAVLGRNVEVVPCFSRKVETVSNESPPKEKLRFGYFGRLIPEKGIDVICELSQDSELRHIDFNLWGEGPTYPPAYFDAFPNIKYNGTYSGRDGLAKVIASLDAYMLISSHGEGLPISLLEVMSAGLPWIATDKGGIPEIACDPISTRVIPASSGYDEIKANLIQFVVDIQNGKVSRNKQIDFYNKRFSSAALVKQWQDVFKIA